MNMRITHVIYLFPILIGLDAQVQHFASGKFHSLVLNSTRSPETPKPARRWRQVVPDTDATHSRCRIGSEDIQCLPYFQNIAQGVFVHASSTCGMSKVQRLCRSDGTCQMCSVNSSKWRFSANRLTDTHSVHNQTCWASGSVRPGGMDQAINLTLSLGKRFEVHYVSLQPCSIGALPDSVAIYKSSDFGRTWRPWHYFSTDCYRAFGLPTTNEHNTHITTANLQEVLCVALQPQKSYLTKQMRRRRSMGTKSFPTHPSKESDFSELDAVETSLDSVLSFSTTLGRPATEPWSPALIDWMTMTDLRISLLRFPTSDNVDYRSKRTVHLPDHSQIRNRRRNFTFWTQGRQYRQKHSDYRSGYRLPRSTATYFNDLILPTLNDQLFANESVGNSTKNPPTSDVDKLSIVLTPRESDVLDESEFYAFADLAIGGRCKCNGHAKECILDADNQLRCACEHNTEGPDCERCKPGYMDRPWERANAQKANSCTQCDCNLHSNECRFSNALYLMSNRISGGVCENCQHNTAGRNCQHCAEGYHRDWTKPISHEQVCIACRCHPIGSLIRHDCDRRSGQCRCKQGVTGLTCDRCQDGYHQTRSPNNPCTKDYLPQAVAMAHTPVDIHCAACNTNKERIRLKKFCRKDAVFQATFKSRELHGTIARFEMLVMQVWRFNHLALRGTRALYWPARTSYGTSSELNENEDFERYSEDRGNDLVPVWVRLNELRCKCPEMELGINYLVVTDFESHMHNGRQELSFTSKTALLPWRPSWRRRLVRFHRRQLRGACDRFADVAKLNDDDSGGIVGGVSSTHYPKGHEQGDEKMWYNSRTVQQTVYPQQQIHTQQPTLRTAYRASQSTYKQRWPYLTN
ncbi:Netrin-1 [Paragonimus heterotremus]|uniref:Netrin-1 n=1 Tax=Paragonimus heterotremus TaxID=100268 RepID=A0A8J4TLG5_9TREM|nr:Netrin-1 [Paragonimus heterotremus]